MDLGIEGHLNGSRGFFRFGADAVCYGQAVGDTRPYVNGNLFDALQAVRLDENKVLLPFDVDQVLNNLRYERYVTMEKAGWRRRGQGTLTTGCAPICRLACASICNGLICEVGKRGRFRIGPSIAAWISCLSR